MIGAACLSTRLALILGLALLAGRLAAADAEESGSRPVSDREMETLQKYSRNATDDWLKSNLGMSLSDLELVWDPATLSFQQRSALDRQAASAQRRKAQGAPAFGAKPAAGKPGAGAPSGAQKSLSLSLQQSDDLRRLGKDLRDLPFGLEVKGDLPVLARLTALETRIWVPFSWRDEWRAEASLPLAWPGAKHDSLWKEMGFSKRLSLRSDYSNRLGRNQVEAGLGTDWSHNGLGTWSVDYDVHMKYGQGENEAIHWLKLSKEF